MEHGQGAQHALVRVAAQGREERQDLGDIRGNIALRELCTLRCAGSARGVEDQRGRFTSDTIRGTDFPPVATESLTGQGLKRDGVWGKLGQLLAFFADRRQRQVTQGQLLGARHRVDHVDRNDGLQRSLAAHLLQHGGGLVPANRDAGAVILEQAFQLVGRIERVVLDDSRTNFLDGIKSNNVLRAVRQQHRHAVSRTYAEGLQAGGDSAHVLV